MRNRVLSIIVVLMLAAALVLPGASTASAATGSITFVSDASTMVTATTSGLAVPHNAALAWVHPTWNSIVNHTFPADARWIWDSVWTTNPIAGDIVTFERTFDIPDFPTGGTLYITTDNGYQVWINNQFIGEAQLSPGWGPGNLTQAYVDAENWQSVETWDVPWTTLNKGANTLRIVAVNEYMNYDDVWPQGDPWNGAAQPVGTPEYNPAGLIFELNVDYGRGFTYTQGYWKTHSIEETMFFSSGQTYMQVMNTSVAGGNAYYQLAHQYIAAKLNVENGAWMRADVLVAFNRATVLFSSAGYTPALILTYKKGNATQKGIFAEFNQLAGILDAYNNGNMDTPHAP